MNCTCCELVIFISSIDVETSIRSILLHGLKGEGGPLVVGHYQHRLLNHLTFYTPRRRTSEYPLRKSFRRFYPFVQQLLPTLAAA